MPEVGPRERVPGPVGGLGVGEDDARAAVLLVGVAPHVELALGRAGLRAPRALEPRVLVRGVVDHQLGDDAQVAPVRLVEHQAEVVQRAVLGVHVLVLADVVAVVPQWRRIERHQPQRVDAQVLDVVQLRGDALEVAHAVVVGVEEGLDVELVDDRVLVPERRIARLARGEFLRLLGQRDAARLHVPSTFKGFVVALAAQVLLHCENMRRRVLRRQAGCHGEMSFWA